MDISKLPKLSKTDAPATPPSPNDSSTATRAENVPDYRARGADEPPLSVGEIWFSLIVGVIFLLLGGTFARYLVTRVTHQPFHTNVNWTAGPKTGQEVEYLELQGRPWLTDAGMFLIGLAIVLDALVRVCIYKQIRAARPLAYLTFAITIAAVLFNLYVVGTLMGTMLPLLSLLAVAMGGYIAFVQWQVIKAFRRAAPI
jgi:hypothetical protein